MLCAPKPQSFFSKAFFLRTPHRFFVNAEKDFAAILQLAYYAREEARMSGSDPFPGIVRSINGLNSAFPQQSGTFVSGRLDQALATVFLSKNPSGFEREKALFLEYPLASACEKQVLSFCQAAVLDDDRAMREKALRASFRLVLLAHQRAATQRFRDLQEIVLYEEAMLAKMLEVALRTQEPPGPLIASTLYKNLQTEYRTLKSTCDRMAPELDTVVQPQPKIPAAAAHSPLPAKM